jgi:hypothetical protein
VSKPRTLFMETTEIAAEKTAGQITSLLIACGARHIAMDYDAQGKITGMKFVLLVGGRMPFPFAMPVRTEPVFKILNGRRKFPYDRTNCAAKDRDQAERVAWRQLLRWLEAQLGMIDAGMASAHEVFLPYLQDAQGKTAFEVFEATRFRELPEAKEA